MRGLAVVTQGLLLKNTSKVREHPGDLEQAPFHHEIRKGVWGLPGWAKGQPDPTHPRLVIQQSGSSSSSGSDTPVP